MPTQAERRAKAKAKAKANVGGYPQPSMQMAQPYPQAQERLVVTCPAGVGPGEQVMISTSRGQRVVLRSAEYSRSCR